METTMTNIEREHKLKNESRDRRIRIINDIIGEYRIYQGIVILQDTIEARTRTDADLLFDIQDQYDAGTAIAYWADGSLTRNSGQNCLGAGVAWQERDPNGDWEWWQESFRIGVDTGSSADAELFAIAAALELAKACQEQGKSFETVRIFSDCRSLLEDLEHGRTTDLGPALASGWALQNIYDCTDDLVNSGVSVQLVWQKGHAMSDGNNNADIAAYNAAQSQTCLLSTGKSVWKDYRDTPRGLVNLGSDSEDEWYWRVNRVLMLEGPEESDQVEVEVEDEEDTGSQGSVDMDLSD